MSLATTQYTYGGINLQNKRTWNLRLLSPNESHERRGDNVLAPGILGRAHVAKVLEQRQLSLALFVTGEVPGQPPSAEVLAANLDTLLRVFQTDGQQTLTRKRGTRLESALAECTGVNVVPRGPYHVDLIADLMLADPLWYATTQTVASAALTAVPGVVSVANSGTYQAEKLTVSFACPASPAATITNPKITIGSVWVKYTGVVAAGATLTIDVDGFAADIDGDDVTGDVSHSGSVRWLLVPVGSTDATVSADSISGTVTASIAFYAPFL